MRNCPKQHYIAVQKVNSKHLSVRKKLNFRGWISQKEGGMK